MTPKLLFIDDEDIVLKSSRRIFAGSGYEIDVASSGDEGLALARAKDYDIVVTDLKMPGLGGMEVLKTLRRDRPGTTVIIFTGYSSVDTAREALKAGAFDYIPKPFTPEELRSVVANALEARRNAAGAKMLDLMAIVSHELKSPLAAMQTTADTLYRGYFGKLEPEQEKIVGTILRNCSYLEDIIRSYIDLSKMELDGLTAFKKRVPFASQVLAEALKAPGIRDNPKKMPIVTELEGDPVLDGDPDLLKILVGNLVNNAIKYGAEGTPVRLRLSRTDGEVRFAVRNEGVGIPEEAKGRLFKRFERLKQKGTEGVKGSGLGLYICKTIVDKHKGRIWVEGEPGKWVEFLVALPVAGGEAASGTPGA
ncbi:MAG TPA: response regulator [Candidatus Aminicenantes bacterium]|nr:response regulator [Candidatus Aminicenantes bacterium]HRY63879.1 response regulator [Candidatus Aminicenantes bacterium]HRZ70792.1 response regulator [Candidatus Aminicenantes bacterium]